MADPLLEARELVRSYRRAVAIRAVDGVSLAIERGTTLGLVGESGSGKSTLARLITGLEPPDQGEVRLDGVRRDPHDGPAMRRTRRRIQMVFQDPYSSLNPRMPVGDTIGEGLIIHRLVPRRALGEAVTRLLLEVGLDPADAPRYPHEFSGGQRQRIGLARALAVSPDLLVCDEPVSALDVSVQAQILNLLADLRTQRGLACLFIAHDLAVVRQVADRIAVMFAGRLVESGPASTVVSRPRHPYTHALRAAVPSLDPVRTSEGTAPRTADPGAPVPATGCPYACRCAHPARDTRCATEAPRLRSLGDHLVACHHVEET